MHCKLCGELWMYTWLLVVWLIHWLFNRICKAYNSSAVKLYNAVILIGYVLHIKSQEYTPVFVCVSLFLLFICLALCHPLVFFSQFPVTILCFLFVCVGSLFPPVLCISSPPCCSSITCLTSPALLCFTLPAPNLIQPSVTSPAHLLCFLSYPPTSQAPPSCTALHPIITQPARFTCMLHLRLSRLVQWFLLQSVSMCHL